MASSENEKDSAPQKAADAVFVPTQEHGFNNKVQGTKLCPKILGVVILARTCIFETNIKKA